MTDKPPPDPKVIDLGRERQRRFWKRFKQEHPHLRPVPERPPKSTPPDEDPPDDAS